MRLVTCKNCGAKVSDQYSYCTICQAPISAAAIASSTETRERRQTLIESVYLPKKPTPDPKTSIEPKRPQRRRWNYARSSASRGKPTTHGELAILNQSLSGIAANPVILTPALVSALNGVLLLFLIARTTQASQGTEMSQIIWGIIPLLFVSLFVGFLVTIGLASMSVNIVMEGKCNFSDWVTGVREYFWRILNISIVVGILLVVVFGGISLVLPLAIKGLVLNLVDAGTILFLNVCYAAIMISDATLRSAINLGLKTIRMYSRTFIGFSLLLFAVLEVRAILEVGWTGSESLSVLVSLGMNVPMIMYAVMQGFLWPIWSLLSSTLYRNFSFPQATMK